MAAKPPPPKRDASGHWKKARFSLQAVRALGAAEQASLPHHEPEPEPEPEPVAAPSSQPSSVTLGTLEGPLCTIQGQAYTDVQPSAPAEKEPTAEELVLELRTAAMAGDQAWVERLLMQRGVDADEPDGNGWTPLHWAVSNGAIGAATALLRGGADADRKNDSGSSPLFWAARCAICCSFFRAHHSAALLLISARLCSFARVGAHAAPRWRGCCWYTARRPG